MVSSDIIMTIMPTTYHILCNKEQTVFENHAHNICDRHTKNRSYKKVLEDGTIKIIERVLTAPVFLSYELVYRFV